MSELFNKISDDIGPERVYLWYDPETHVRGVVVIDTTVFGTADGGTRMLHDITVEEMAELARGMTYKFSSFDIPIGGAKCGIWANPKIGGSERRSIFRAFGRAIRPLLSSRILLNTGTDMGTYYEDLKTAFRASGRVSLGREPQIDGDPVTDLATGYGVTVAAREACRFLNINFEESSVAIEGFGKVGGSVLKSMVKLGAKIVAISTIDGCLYNPKGLDIDLLLKERDECGDECVLSFAGARHLPKEALFQLPVDILVPGARPREINSMNVGKIKAKIISSGANIPMTEEAEEALFRRGIISIPDFIANAGGVISGLILMFGGDQSSALQGVERAITSAAYNVLKASHEDKVNPKKLAVMRARKKIFEARLRGKRLSYKQLCDVIKERIKRF
jgi:glutamate dehydrogenase (NAD(P)+)